MGESQTRSRGKNTSLWALAIPSLLLAISISFACSNAPSGGVDPSGNGSTAVACSKPDQGCPCDSVGLTAECGEVLSKSGGVVTCSLGKRTCDGSAWGACVGDKTMFKSEAPVTRAESQIEGLGQPVPCVNNPCDPDCISINDNGLGLDAGPGLSVNDAGGISLLGKGSDCGADAAADAGADAGPCICATSYTNVAPSATPTLSAGGTISPYQVTDSNDLVLEANNCSVWAWISAGNAPGGGQWLAYTWPSSKKIAKMHMDTASATVVSACGVIGRTAGAAQVQWWDGSKWITDGTISGKLDDWDYTFTAPVTTTQVRLYDMYTTNTLGQQSNPIVFEWQVFEVTTVCPNNCNPDGGAGSPDAGAPTTCTLGVTSALSIANPFGSTVPVTYSMVGAGGGAGGGSGGWGGGGGGGSSAVLDNGGIVAFAPGGNGGAGGGFANAGGAGKAASGSFSLAAAHTLAVYVGGGGGGGGYDYGGGGGSGWFGGGGGEPYPYSSGGGTGGSNTGGIGYNGATNGGSLVGGNGGYSGVGGFGGNAGNGGNGGSGWDSGGGGGGFGGGGGATSGPYGAFLPPTAGGTNGGDSLASLPTLGALGSLNWALQKSVPPAAGAPGTIQGTGGNAGLVILTYTSPNGQCSMGGQGGNTPITNVAVSATITLSSGGSVAPNAPSNCKDNIDQNTKCTDWAYINAGTVASGEWAQYTWSAAQTLTKMHMDTRSDSVKDSCGNVGGTLGAADVQWWDGSKWITDGTVTGQYDDWDYTFTQPVTTTQVRLFNVRVVTAAPQPPANPVLVGSFDVSTGPSWPTNPPTYTCQEACSLKFGGNAANYSCSTNSNPLTITHNNYTTIWGIGGCPIAAENYKKSVNYNCGSANCAQSAYCQDNCYGGINYCFKNSVAALPSTCKTVNGVTWCYDNNTCGTSCNSVCAAAGTTPAPDATVFAAQDDPTGAECTNIANAFGIAGPPQIASWTYACLEDTPGTHSVNSGLVGPLYCSTYSGCPTQHLTNMDQLGIPCGAGSRRSICGCNTPAGAAPKPVIFEWQVFGSGPVIPVGPPVLVGSYQVDQGVNWTTNPPTYTCQEGCALKFGGSFSDYSCSTNNNPNTITHTGQTTIWGIGGCSVVAENYKKSANYNCGSSNCAQSAFVWDNCQGAAGTNYCFKASQVVVPPPNNGPLPATCKTVNGVTWCYDNATCGTSCNDVCKAIGSTPASDATVFAAQDDPTGAECTAIANAFGIAGPPQINSWTYACLEDTPGTHAVNSGLVGPLYCSTYSGCPTNHLTNMDQLGIACGGGSRRSICGCNTPTPPPVPVPVPVPAAGCGQNCLGFQCQVAQCPVNSPTTLTGVVLDPAGKNPIFNAYVYVPATLPLPAIPAGAQPDACGGGGNLPPAVTYALTGVDGKFTLTGVPSGSIPLVVQVGKWRRQTTINVSSCVSAAVPAANTRLPKNQGEGNMPHIAITANGCDPMECLLTRIGIDSSEFKSPGAGGAVDYYLGDGIPLSGGSNPPPSTFMQNVNTLKPYDLVMLPCDCGTEYINSGPWSFVGAPTYSALSQYLGGGGRLFASHYGRKWIESPFPGVANWAPDGALNYGDPNVGLINLALPTGADFSSWMSYIGAASSPGKFTISPTRYDTYSTTGLSKQVVTYQNGNVPADFTFDAPLNVPVAQQYGRGMYTDMHLAQGGQSFTFPQECPVSPLTAQEDAAEFLLFNLGGCITPLPPPAPAFGPATFTRQFTAVCPAGKYVQWRDFAWQDTIPSNGSGTANITFTVQTGDNAQSLGAVIPLAVSTVSHPVWILASVANAIAGANQVSHPMLQVNMALNPTPDKNLAPTLIAWQQTFDCVDAL